MAPQKTICVESVAVVRSSALALHDSYLYPTFIMMDLMEVNTSHRSSGPRDTSSSLLSSLSFEKHTKDVLLQGQWTMLNDNMTVISLTWKTSIVAAEQRVTTQNCGHWFILFCATSSGYLQKGIWEITSLWFKLCMQRWGVSMKRSWNNRRLQCKTV